MRTQRYFMLLILMLLMVSGCAAQADDRRNVITISAAASMKDSLEEIQEEFYNVHPDISLVFNYGSSGALKRQIEQGAPVDAFLSASKKHFVDLLEEEYIFTTNKNAFASNAIVMVTHKNSEFNRLNELLQNGKRIALAIPETTPAGKYAQEALENMGAWESMQSRIVFGKDVRHVLTLVEQQSVDGGLVYQSDAVSSQKVKVIKKLDASLYSPIGYYAGVVKKSENRAQAELFTEFLHQKISQDILVANGFLYPK
ncbi:molybdate ABC transporter substrate-binding protein [Jeotgalibacillus soli]|uniref:Molybdenum ABC transporter substrate-binding protein n=1 Tax=Jeotgalibacillus soli TaxID=889306 RepID=A0A0C2RNP1_9BACL|nr:molybdate ABC transporter substrate-binding protein [Jeotgalibacillus soli]KIL51895.1 hypothetical protein KP78_02650 [Jeotgalibacillus soli]